jgi:hypothetical protein
MASVGSRNPGRRFRFGTADSVLHGIGIAASSQEVIFEGDLNV